MSLGSPSQLGTLLIQRLDTLFGLTQSQQTNLSSGARPDAVIPTERGQPTHSLQNPGAKPLPKTRSSSEKAVATRQAVEKAQTTQKAISQTDTLSSIQTRLGTTAQFILKLLQTYPHADPIRAQQPLLNTQEHQNQIQTPQSRTTKKPIQPLLPLTKHLQQNLKKTVQQSGLFYEAQLARHLEGKLANKQQLLAQPQNQTKAHTQNSPQPIAQNVASTHHTIPEQL